jgi:hypothetical protein
MRVFFVSENYHVHASACEKKMTRGDRSISLVSHNRDHQLLDVYVRPRPVFERLLAKCKFQFVYVAIKNSGTALSSQPAEYLPNERRRCKISWPTCN